ncbi:NXPE family member 3-like isoform X2 [Anneissia japonica]|uniref:NXPE family member 3-like isoform X2 n=2 Tax=Anneissia japonica TaxID=1529436 RepID=UPI0014258BDC|nr:NXPE family member 3-like isoform X2 [Anneissia japonica]
MTGWQRINLRIIICKFINNATTFSHGLWTFIRITLALVAMYRYFISNRKLVVSTIIAGTCFYISFWAYTFEDYKPIGILYNLVKNSTTFTTNIRTLSNSNYKPSRDYTDNCTEWTNKDYNRSLTVRLHCYEFNKRREGILNIQKEESEVFFVSYINQSLQYGRDICVRLDSYVLNGTTVKPTNGGDFFFAISNSIRVGKENFSTAGKVIDHLNGSYSFYFAAAWSGPTNISILRVHSSEAVEWIREIMWKVKRRVFWTGIYKCQQNHKEESLCYVDRQNTNNANSSKLCLYRNVEALGKTTLTCQKPAICNCSQLSSHKAAQKKILERAQSFLKNRMNLFKGINLEFYVIKNFEIHVKDSGKKQKTDGVYSSDIRRSDGFWVNNSWHSFACTGRHFENLNIKELSTCLQNKKISLLGDSTFRQWFHELVDIFNRKKHSNKLQMFHRVIDHNIDIFFQFHPLILGQKIISFASVKYESEIIREMHDCNRVVVVGPWAHYGQWTKEGYLDRLYGIRDAVVDFLQRCPNAIVAIKGSHPRNHKDINVYIYGNDYIYRQYNLLLREVFKGIGAVFLDVWDMNISYYASNTLHMPQAVIRQEMNLLFACHVCR